MYYKDVTHNLQGRYTDVIMTSQGPCCKILIGIDQISTPNLNSDNIHVDKFQECHFLRINENNATVSEGGVLGYRRVGTLGIGGRV